MKFTLKIESDNAAMVDNPQEGVARILESVARLVHEGEYYSGTVHDSNGNTVGTWAMQVDESEEDQT